MAKYHGKNSDVFIADSGGTVREISLYVSQIDAPSDQDTVDVSGMGDTKKNYVTGLQDTTVTFSGPWDDTATSGLHVVLSGLVGGTAGKLFSFAPKGSASTFPRFEGTYLVKQYNVQSSIGGAVTYTCVLTPFGTAGGAWGTYA